MAMEDFEYAQRKFGAFLMIVFGYIIIGFSAFFGIISFQGNITSALGGILIGGIIGVILVAYGSYVNKKVSHIVWTKQAIREMMDKEFRAEGDFRKRFSSSDSAPTINYRFNCPNCGAEALHSTIFCTECGAKLLDPAKKYVCTHCKFESEDVFDYCPECGHKKEAREKP